MKQLLSIFFLFITLQSFTQVQVRTSVDRTDILIGEPVSLSLEAYMPLGENFNWFNIDTIPHFEIISRSKIDTTETFNGKKVSQTFSITSFDSGRWEFPAFAMVIGKARYITDTLSVRVNYAQFNKEEEYHEIKDIIDVDSGHKPWLPWVIGIGSLLALLASWLLLRKKKKPVAKAPVIQLSPYEEAMRELERIRLKGFRLNGEVKEFYSSLNDVLRIYLERKLQLNGMEKTNEEIINDLRSLPLPAQGYQQLSEALRVADFVKFAKYHPDEQLNEQNFLVIRNAIESLNKN